MSSSAKPCPTEHLPWLCLRLAAHSAMGGGAGAAVSRDSASVCGEKNNALKSESPAGSVTPPRETAVGRHRGPEGQSRTGQNADGGDSV